MLKLPIGWSDYAGVVSGYKKLLANRIEKINNDNSLGWFTKWRYRWGARFRHFGNLIGVYTSDITFFTLLGWLFTAIAVSLGAPYWFDLLNKLINMRNAGKAAPKTAQVVIQDKTK